MKKIFQTLLFVSLIGFIGCKQENEPSFHYDTSIALSVFASEQNQICITTLVNKNNTIFTEYWIDQEKTNLAGLKALLPAKEYFRTSIDKNYLATTVYRNGLTDKFVYQFPRNYSLYSEQLIYFKDGQKHKLDTTALGAVYAVDASEEPVIAGFFGQQKYGNYGAYLAPTVPFYQGSDKKIHQLPMPRGYFYFDGISAIHRYDKDVYIAGKFDFPMYWKNEENVRLHQNYGEINQIKVINGDVYAVGFYNKRNSNSTGHTACYWVNNQLVELEDNAIAYGIALLGKEVYVVGATGRHGAEYKACYWRNGKRTTLGSQQPHP